MTERKRERERRGRGGGVPPSYIIYTRSYFFLGLQKCAKRLEPLNFHFFKKVVLLFVYKSRHLYFFIVE